MLLRQTNSAILCLLKVSCVAMHILAVFSVPAAAVADDAARSRFSSITSKAKVNQSKR